MPTGRRCGRLRNWGLSGGSASSLWTLQRSRFEPDVAADDSDRGENRDPGRQHKEPLTREARLENGPVDARVFFGFTHVVRRFRVSGLVVRQFTRRGPVWRCADRVQIGVARSKRSETHWFSRSRLIDRLPLPSDWPSHILDDSKRDRRLTRGPRPKLGRPRPSSSAPRRSALCGWPAPPRRQGGAFSSACARARTPRERPCGKPIERRSSRR